MSHSPFVYSTLHEWSTKFYSELLTLSHQIGERKPINMGNKENPDIRVFYIFKKDMKQYALPEEYLGELPILVTKTEKKINYRDVFDIITGFQSAKFRPVKAFEYRELINKLCDFEHAEPKDYALWRICATASLLGRVAFRVCSQPAFGKDSVMKVLGYLTGDVCVIANPTVAKLEYRLMNKVILLNEFANLKADDRYGMEHLLQSVGDMSNTYEKRSRASQGTTEKFNIGDLSVVCAYNDLSCYQDNSKYFDSVFSDQTKDRFLPLKFRGQIKQQIPSIPDPKAEAAEHAEFLQAFMRTITYYRKHWRDEVAPKRQWGVKCAADYGFKGRWATNFDQLRDFILLYSETPEEAQSFLNTLYNRHIEYLEMVRGGSDMFKPKEPEDLKVVLDEMMGGD